MLCGSMRLGFLSLMLSACFPVLLRYVLLLTADFSTRTTRYNHRFTSAPPELLISRLTSQNMHLLALRISSFLELKPDVVLRHWASAKIMHSQRIRESGEGGGDDDEVVCAMIVEKFESLGGGAGGGDGVSYSEVARKAWGAGRGRLATMVRSFVAFFLDKKVDVDLSLDITGTSL